MASMSTTPIHVAALEGDLSALQRALKSGKHLANLPDTDGCTPLHYAAASGHLDVVKFLLDNNAKVDQQDNYKKTALFYSAECGEYEICECLVKNGANANTKAKNGDSPIDVAEKKRFNDVASMLKSTPRGNINSGSKSSLGSLSETNMERKSQPQKIPTHSRAALTKNNSLSSIGSSNGSPRPLSPKPKPTSQYTPQMSAAYSWNVTEICEWLEGLGFIPDPVIDAFEENEVDGEVLLEDVTMQVLKEDFAITQFGRRAKLMKEIRKLIKSK